MYCLHRAEMISGINYSEIIFAPVSGAFLSHSMILTRSANVTPPADYVPVARVTERSTTRRDDRVSGHTVSSDSSDSIIMTHL